jgi:hypothetical protein
MHKSWGPPSLVSNEYRGSFPGVKRPGREAEPLTAISAAGQEYVDLYIYSP